MNWLKRGVLMVMFAAFGAQAQTSFYWTNTAASGVQVWNADNWTNSAGAGVRPANGGNAAYILNFNRDATYTVSNDFSSAPFILNGVGVMGLTLTRNVTLNGSGLMLTNNGSLRPVITNGSVYGAAYFDMPLTLGTNTIIAAANNCTILARAAVGGDGGLIVSSEPGGVVGLEVNNTFVGGVDVFGGTLRIATANSLGPGSLTLRAGTRLWIIPAAGIIVTNDIAVGGDSTVNNAYSTGEKYTGRLSGAATLSVTNLGLDWGTNALANYGGTLELNLGAATSALRLYQTGLYSATNATLNLKNGTLSNTVAASINLGALTGTANGYVNLGTNTLTVGYLGQTNTFAGVIQQAKLVKVGTGMLVLSGVNTYTNTTTVSNGTLLVSGSITGSVNVAGGTLGGTGSVAGSVTNSGFITAADTSSIGTLAVTNLTMKANSSYVWNCYSASSQDVVNVNGTLTLPTVATVTVSKVQSGSIPSSAVLFNFGNCVDSGGSTISDGTMLSGWVLNGAAPGSMAKVSGKQVVMQVSGGMIIEIY